MIRQRAVFFLSQIVVVGTLIVALPGITPTSLAAPLPQDVSGCAQEYNVQADDWLSKLADKYLGSVDAYPAIVEATNRQHAKNQRFAHIENPDYVKVGWLLCIPPAASATSGQVPDESEKTQAIRFEPQVPEGESQPGKCTQHSRVWGREDAWHCDMQNGDILDPCFSVTDAKGEKVVVCGADPITGTMAGIAKPFVVSLTQPLTTTTVSADARQLMSNNGWKLVLFDGGTCDFTVLAEPMTLDGKSITYHCTSSQDETPLVIVGDLLTGDVWTGQQFKIFRGEDGPAIQDPQTIKIKTVWQ